MRSRQSARLLVPSLLALAACTPEPAPLPDDVATTPVDATVDTFAPVDRTGTLDAPAAIDAPDVASAADASDAVAPPDAVDVPPSVDVPPVDAPDVTDVPPVVDVPGDRPTTLRCDGPRALRLPADLVHGTLSNAGGTLRASERCAHGLTAEGEEHVYALTLPARTVVQLIADSEVDPVLSVRRACDDASSEVLCDDSTGFFNLTSRIRAILDPGEYRVIVDRHAGGMSEGDYRLSLRTFTPAANALCARAIELPPGTDVTGDSAGAVHLFPCGVGDAPQVYYRLSIPPRTRANIRIRSVGTPGSFFAVFDDCVGDACVEAGQTGSPPDVVDNTTDAPRAVIVAVNSQSPEVTSVFTLRADLVPLAANAFCTAAMTLAPGSSVTGNTDFGAVSSGCSAGYGTELFYRVTVPARSHVPVTITPQEANGHHLAVRDACGDALCRDFESVRLVPYTTELLNGGDAPRDHVVSVAGLYGTFVLGAGAAAPLGAGLACELAQPLAPGATLSGDVLGAVGTWASCRAIDLQERQRGYAVTVPAGHRVDVAVRPERSGLHLVAAEGCALDALCRVSAPPTASALSVSLANPGGAARTFPLALSADSAAPTTTSIPYTVTASAPVALVPGETCQNPFPLAAGETAAGTAATGASRWVCASQPTRFYRVTIPPATVGTVTVARVGTVEADVSLVSGCPGFLCDATAQRNTLAGPVAWSYGNPGPAPVEFVVGVAPRSSPGAFNVSFATAPAPGYALATASASACEVLDAPVYVPLRGDDDVTRPIALPFPFRFYGVAQTHYTMSTNGLLQFVAADGAGSTASDPTQLPSTAAPRNVVAALWDDLEADARSSAHRQVFGVAPDRHLVVEWAGYALGPFARLTFQVRLDEATGRVQVSFCDVRVTDRLDYYSRTESTVGLQNADGTVGHLAAWKHLDLLRGTRRFTFDAR